MPHYGICEKCGEPVGTADRYHRNPAWPVTGWEVGRATRYGGTAGGANQIKLRERTPDRVRHEGCLPNGSENQGRLM